jgi:hypothetical protein
MPNNTNDLPPSVNHVFVDYENVHGVDPAIIGSKTAHVTLLLGAKQTKLDATLVEKMLHHAANVELVRLKTSGRNAVDFALAYYLGRAVLADPCGYFHVVSKDKGYDALIEHLRSKHIHVRRNDDFTTLTFSASPKSAPTPARPPVEPPAPAPAATAAPAPARPPTLAKTPAKQPAKAAPPPPKPASEKSYLETLEEQVLAHFHKPKTPRPGTKSKLVSFLLSHLGKKVVAAEVLELVDMMRQAGHLVIHDKGKVTYYLEPK